MSEPQQVAQAAVDRMMAVDRVAPALGIAVDSVAPGQVSVSMLVTDAMINGVEMAHGGYIFLLADCAFAVACNTHGVTSVARAAEIEFLQPARRGERLIARAVERRLLGRRGIYDVSVSTDDGRPIAEFRGHSSALPR